MRKLTLLAAVVLAAAATLTLPATTAAATAVDTVPVAGTTSDGGTFAGTFAVEELAMQDGQVVALGTVSGTSTDAAGNAVAVRDAAASAPVQAQQQPGEGCTLLAFSFGPFDINVAGLITIHLEPIALDVQLHGLLGTLLCGVLGGGGTPAPAPPQ